MPDNREFQERVGRIEGLVHEIESIADPALRAAAKDLVGSLMDLHRAGLERALEIVSKAGDAGGRIIHSLGADELVSSLLVLYDLHPDDFETRVKRGIEKARQLLARRGAGVELLGTDEGMVRLQIDKGGHSCGSTAKELELTVREALFETAPDAVDVIIAGTEEQPASGFVPLASLQNSNGFPRSAPAPIRP